MRQLASFVPIGQTIAEICPIFNFKMAAVRHVGFSTVGNSASRFIQRAKMRHQ